MLSKQPVRIRRDWNVAVVACCDFCSHSKMTVPHADGGRICASCCDSEFLSSWQNYARSLATELLSLREQLDTERRRADESGNRFYKAVKYGARLEEEIAALKQLPTFAEVVSKFGDPEAFGEREIKLLIDLRGVPYGTLLFTAAKPAED
ncbi:hypothetical protein V2A84_09675 [Yersinia sp. 2553 StPb PI]|uniref:hypothetical protein n=1 Tax=Yersinia sp. 2553 StPb PI TaxID=3117411 RepID=UPI003FA4D120